MAGRKEIKTASYVGESLTLGDVIETVKAAEREGLPMDSQVKIAYEPAFFRDFISIVHDPTRRGVTFASAQTPVEQAIESGGDRLVELGFVRSSDSRKPVVIRLQIQDDASNIVIASVDLTEHQFAMLLSGSVVKAKDNI
jgi:hypothetical protein